MNTKITVSVIAIVVIVLGAFYFFRSYQNVPTSANIPVPAGAIPVSIVNFSFNPATTTIAKGGTVVWTNNDAVPHQIAGGELNGPVINKGQTYFFTFNTAGTFNYHCAIHPSMTGTIVVQ